MIEGNGIELGIVFGTLVQFQMPLTDDALMNDFEYTFEDRLQEILTPLIYIYS